MVTGCGAGFFRGGIAQAIQGGSWFRVELVASEPMVKDPVFVDWDDQGRMWVGELRTYMRDLDGNRRKRANEPGYGSGGYR